VLTGIRTVLAGSGTSGYTEGTGTNAVFNGPMGIGINSVNLLYVTDQNNHCIRTVTTAGKAINYFRKMRIYDQKLCFVNPQVSLHFLLALKDPVVSWTGP
jgi:hypothetical protein